MVQKKSNCMSDISYEKALEHFQNSTKHFYDKENSLCIFPDTFEQIDMCLLSKCLNDEAVYVTKNTSYKKRLEIRTKDEWKSFTTDLKKKYHWICQVSHYGIDSIKSLSWSIFGIKPNETWANSFLTVHHVDGESEYECYDETKLIVINRAIHMMLHRYENLLPKIPRLKTDYALWYELGSLIHTSDGKWPWKEIKKN